MAPYILVLNLDKIPSVVIELQSISTAVLPQLISVLPQLIWLVLPQLISVLPQLIRWMGGWLV